MFNEEGQSNYLVAFMRLLTSMQIKKEADLYINFLDGEVDVHNFCALEFPITLLYYISFFQTKGFTVFLEMKDYWIT